MSYILISAMKNSVAKPDLFYFALTKGIKKFASS